VERLTTENITTILNDITENQMLTVADPAGCPDTCPFI